MNGTKTLKPSLLVLPDTNMKQCCNFYVKGPAWISQFHLLQSCRNDSVVWEKIDQTNDSFTCSFIFHSPQGFYSYTGKYDKWYTRKIVIHSFFNHVQTTCLDIIINVKPKNP